MTTPDPSPKGEPELPEPGQRIGFEGGNGPGIPCGYTAEQMLAFYAAGLRAGMLRAAGQWEIAHGFDKHGVGAFIRKEAGNV